jgi:hypothetical protein
MTHKQDITDRAGLALPMSDKINFKGNLFMLTEKGILQGQRGQSIRKT